MGLTGKIALSAAALVLLGAVMMPFIIIGQYLGGGLDKATGASGGALCSVIPEPYKTIFRKAGEKFTVQPAAIGAIFVGEHPGIKDNNFDSNKWPDPNGPWASSPVGASGPFQFMPGTWAGNKQDGNGDGKIEIQNLEDSAFSAAHLLANIGAGGNTTDEMRLRNAASKYNSGRPWEKGQNIAETKRYVDELFLPAFNKFYCQNTPSSANGVILKLLTKSAAINAATGVPKVIVVHYWGGNVTPENAYDYFNTASEKSSHYFIAHTGEIYQFLDENRGGAHAMNYNRPESDYGKEAISIGIENEGNFESNNNDLKVQEKQYQANLRLIKYLMGKYGIKSDQDESKSAVISHKEADKRAGLPEGRRSDPGEEFMKRLLKDLR